MKFGAHVYLWQVARRARAANLELILSPGGAWPMEADISLADAAHRRQGLDWHRKQLDLCATCGAVAYAGAIYGHPGRVERRLPSDGEQVRVAEGLRELAEYANARNVKLAVEPMSHFRTHVANTPAQINAVCNRANHPNLFTVLDTYHLATEVTDMAQAFVEMESRLLLLHACENNRGAPGTGLLPWDSLLSAMRRTGWERYVGFEGYNSTWRDGRFACERGMFHNVCPDAEAFIRQSMEFLTSHA
jgi:D-psicose/D-tagatose/L-ribulose 3-epimerase